MQYIEKVLREILLKFERQISGSIEKRKQEFEVTTNEYRRVK